jgi:hypothetical protein
MIETSSHAVDSPISAKKPELVLTVRPKSENQRNAASNEKCINASKTLDKHVRCAQARRARTNKPDKCPSVNLTRSLGQKHTRSCIPDKPNRRDECKRHGRCDREEQCRYIRVHRRCGRAARCEHASTQSLMLPLSRRRSRGARVVDLRHQPSHAGLTLGV